jgi:3-deoxy-D-manno-octulosonic-acid transferase
MRFLYTAIFYLILPFLFIRLYRRGVRNADFRKRWAERLAFYSQPHQPVEIFFHAVSVGEAESLFSLIEQLLTAQPKLNILVTTTTPTGSARVKAVLADRVQHVYLPYDYPDAIARFLKHFQPKIAVIVETEIWPNLFHQCAKQQIPLLIINARLSEHSYQGYQKLAALTKPALNHVSFIAAQTQQDAARFNAFVDDKSKVQVLGNIKFDLRIDSGLIEQGQRLRQKLFPNRFVWIIASTHKGEEPIFLEIYQQLKPKIPQLLLLLVPRNLERFEEVKQLCEKQQFQVVTRTSAFNCSTATDVYLGDTIGELKLLYTAADVAFVGGSMVDVGGHNVLEPVAIGIPLMFGHYMYNFNKIADGLLNADAAIQCRSGAEIADNVLSLYQQPDKKIRLINNAKAFMQQNQGTTQAVISLLNRFLA